MHRITETLCLLLAPILSFTADEAWEALGHSDSVHLELFPEFEEVFPGEDATGAVEQLLEVRSVIQQAIEKARQEKRIGSNLEASVELTLPTDKFTHDVFNHFNVLEEFFILSELNIVRVEGAEPSAVVKENEHAKCARCWKWLPSVGQHETYDDLCDRCADAVAPTNAN